MVSSEALVEQEASEEQSALRQSADAFQDKAESEGWVEASSGLIGMANSLLGAASSSDDEAKASYAERVDAGSETPFLVYTRIESDAATASGALDGICSDARDLLATGEVSREDVKSFETALVTAQKSYRSFATATGLVAQRAPEGGAAAEAALSDLSGQIDTSRTLADALSEAYKAAASAEDGLTS